MPGLLSAGFVLVFFGRQHRLCCSLFNAISTAWLLPEHSMFWALAGFVFTTHGRMLRHPVWISF